MCHSFMCLFGTLIAATLFILAHVCLQPVLGPSRKPVQDMVAQVRRANRPHTNLAALRAKTKITNILSLGIRAGIGPKAPSSLGT